VATDRKAGGGKQGVCRIPISILLSFFAVLVLPLVGSISAVASEDGLNAGNRSPIVFERLKVNTASGLVREGSKLWIMEGDGSNLQQLTTGKSFHDHPSFMPGGQEVLYAEFPADITRGMPSEYSTLSGERP